MRIRPNWPNIVATAIFTILIAAFGIILINSL